MRESSNDAGARKLAQTPTLFRESRNPDKFIVIPITSSENRRYIPIGYLNKNTIAGNTLFIIENANLYHFGILTSYIHNLWMRTVGGRLEMRYRYSKDIVYNNFPFPNPSDKQKTEIERLAQAILDARSLFPNSSLADLYDPLAMPKELLKAHQKLDKAVEIAYGRTFDNDNQRLSYLFELYQKLSGELFTETKKTGKGKKIN